MFHRHDLTTINTTTTTITTSSLSSPVRPVVPPFQLWRPPADPDKPPCPYRTGFTVDIKSHVPPAPFGGRSYGSGPRAIMSQHDLRSLKQTELVMPNPPLETADPPVPQIHTLSMIREIAVVDRRGPQLALCTIKPKGLVGHTSFQAVAKIYDPLYYSFSQKDVPSDYSREAAAYEHLEAVGQAGSFAPKYFGSWTFTIGLQIDKTTPPQSKPVRLILIEYLPGKSIHELCAGPVPAAATFDEAYRLESINHNDLAARNVILHAPPTPQGQMAAQPRTIPRVALIDYNSSVIYARTIYKIGPYDDTTLPPNPMWTHWNDSLQEFYGWIPIAWETNSRLRQEWLRRCFGSNHLARHAPLENEPGFDEY
ncbi:hypothetical protein C7999DRAFT_40722 [Corynascus novoguineensis]|uniref:Uncharacterized protein n=1 Tax=Corynascus novoguineensis TaxID=1126955 RepID=A0AAN7CWB4_9PEZI|nr:hypothetical protein C7999DRAFT_40722 [Corynascus novoguineensis]